VLGELVRFLEIHPKAGAASPKIIDSDGSINLFSVREYPSIGDALLIQLD